jgi:hypothetical protein
MTLRSHKAPKMKIRTNEIHALFSLNDMRVTVKDIGLCVNSTLQCRPLRHTQIRPGAADYAGILQDDGDSTRDRT